jgi:hypothetical protein
MAGYYCHVCGEYHAGLPMAYGFDVHPALLPPPQERDGRVEMDSDLCVIDNETFLIRGCLEIPVVDGDEDFEWGVWVSLSAKNCNRTLELWDTKGREREPPYFGWLMTRLPGYPETLLLKTNVQTRAVEQREGMTMARVEEIAAMMLHPSSDR